jgi:hypothetical protein
LLDPIYRILDPSGELAHLRFEPIHAQFGVDRGAGTRVCNRGRAAAIDLPLQHAEVPLQTI